MNKEPLIPSFYIWEYQGHMSSKWHRWDLNLWGVNKKMHHYLLCIIKPVGCEYYEVEGYGWNILYETFFHYKRQINYISIILIKKLRTQKTKPQWWWCGGGGAGSEYSEVRGSVPQALFVE